jgi:hypothetical protein
VGRVRGVALLTPPASSAQHVVVWALDPAAGLDQTPPLKSGDDIGGRMLPPFYFSRLGAPSPCLRGLPSQ